MELLVTKEALNAALTIVDKSIKIYYRKSGLHTEIIYVDLN